jgi:hypothetical protein
MLRMQIYGEVLAIQPRNYTFGCSMHGVLRLLAHTHKKVLKIDRPLLLMLMQLYSQSSSRNVHVLNI